MNWKTTTVADGQLIQHYDASHHSFTTNTRQCVANTSNKISSMIRICMNGSNYDYIEQHEQMKCDTFVVSSSN